MKNLITLIFIISIVFPVLAQRNPDLPLREDGKWYYNLDNEKYGPFNWVSSLNRKNDKWVLTELGKQKGGVLVPREFVFMDRAALGLGSVFIHLNAEINWYRVFNEMIEGFDVSKMRETQGSALKKFGLMCDC